MKKTSLFSLVFLLIAKSLFSQSSNEDQVSSPYFFVESSDPENDRLPLKSTKAEVNIIGSIADVIVSQSYTNEGQNPLNAVYIFPGSTEAAVYGLTMQIGDRKIEAEIREKGKARAEYEAAKKEGKRASLLEQHRPNVFQMNVANIQPGETILVSLRYTEMLKPTDGVYEYIYPTVVGPRYSNDQVEVETPGSPTLKAGEAAPFDFDLMVRLGAGMRISDIHCQSHEVKVEYADPKTAIINLNTPGGTREQSRFDSSLFEIANQ